MEWAAFDTVDWVRIFAYRSLVLSIPTNRILLYLLVLFGFQSLFWRSMWGQCGVDVGSMWGRCRVNVGSMWGRWGVDVGSMWSRCKVDVGSMWGRCRVDVRSMWGRYWSLWGRREVDVRSIIIYEGERLVTPPHFFSCLLWGFNYVHFFSNNAAFIAV